MDETDSFGMYFKTISLVAAYSKDVRLLEKSQSSAVFNKLYYRVGSYKYAYPLAFGIKELNKFKDGSKLAGTALERRKLSSGFNQALLGKHSMHFMNIRKCPHCGKAHNRDAPECDDILLHNLFECSRWHSERSSWLSNIEHDFKSQDLPDTNMNTKY